MQILQPTPKRSLRKRGSHTQALRFGTAQPFWTLSQRCCSNKNTRTKANKQETDGLNHVAVLDYFFAVSLALSQKPTRQLNCNNRSNIQDPKIFLQKTFLHYSKTGNNDTAVAFAPLRRPAPILSSHHDDGCVVCCHH